MFRLVNLRNHDLTDVRAVVSFARWVEENGVPPPRFDLLALERAVDHLHAAALGHRASD